MDSNNPILKNIGDPHELEKMFRKEPEAFRMEFPYAWEQNPDSQVLAVWNERLHFKETISTQGAADLMSALSK